MADPQHTSLAKKGTHAIARWREQRYWVRRQLDLSGAYLSGSRLVSADLSRDNLSRIDLTDADLHLADLSGTNLRGAHLWRSNLKHANLRGANLVGASLRRCDLIGCCLKGADLRKADLSYADLSQADLEGANLSSADLTETNLSWANLAGADLRNTKMTATVLDLADLTGADLRGAGLVRVVLHGSLFGEATMEMTLLGDCDLSEVMGLEQVHHAGPSIIGVDSLARSRGLIPDVFLRQAGVPESLIATQEELRLSPKSFSRLLLVGSAKDAAFVRLVRDDLRGSGVLCWSLIIDEEDAFRAGEGDLKRVSYYDRLVLVCSNHSLENPLSCHFFAELTGHGTNSSGQSLLPLALDDQLFSRDDRLCQALREHTTVDFRGWKQEKVYSQELSRLLAALS